MQLGATNPLAKKCSYRIRLFLFHPLLPCKPNRARLLLGVIRFIIAIPWRIGVMRFLLSDIMAKLITMGKHKIQIIVPPSVPCDHHGIQSTAAKFFFQSSK